MKITFEFPMEVRDNLACTYYNIPNDSICNELMELFGFELKEEYVYFENKRFTFKEAPYKITPYIFDTEEIEAIENILNKEYNYAFNASPLLDCLGWVIRKEFDCFRMRYALSSIYDLNQEPLVPWDYDIEEGETDWKHGDDWEDGLDLDKDLPEHWITEGIMAENEIPYDLENIENTDWRVNDTPTVESETSSEEEDTEYYAE